MSFYPIFLSVVFVVRNQSESIEAILSDAAARISSLVADYEFIIVDNASNDNSIDIFKKLIGEEGHANLQIFALTNEVDSDTASWVGLENALGDFIAIIDPLADSTSFLPVMLEKATSSADVVFANNQEKVAQSLAYRIASTIFNKLYKIFNKTDLEKEAPQYRVLSKRVVNFILQHPQPALTYRHLPASGGFTKSNLDYSSMPRSSRTKCLSDSIDRGVRLLVSTTCAPMRVVTILSLFGAIANILYSFYVLAVMFFKKDIAPGWVSLSLQQSGMFFLISLVLLVLGEYILHMSSLSNKAPLYHIGQEFTSSKMTRNEKLNIEASEVKMESSL